VVACSRSGRRLFAGRWAELNRRGGGMRGRTAVIAVALSLVVLSIALLGCGSGGDPYTGKWAGSGWSFTIKPAHKGWWSIQVSTVPDAPVSYGADVNGELQTVDGFDTFRSSGGKLEFWQLGMPHTVELTKQ
jgi:hypothetical protein